jgi:hypothetical protein
MTRQSIQRLVLVSVGLSLLIVASIAGGSVLERNRRAAEQKALREALDRARVSADSCKNTLAYENREFLRFDGVVDSLRAALEEFEDPERGGVPQAVYQDYLDTFDAYNSAVEAWQGRADSLQASEARCRTFVQAHNGLADSIRRLQDEWRGGPAPQG